MTQRNEGDVFLKVALPAEDYERFRLACESLFGVRSVSMVMRLLTEIFCREVERPEAE